MGKVSKKDLREIISAKLKTEVVVENLPAI